MDTGYIFRPAGMADMGRIMEIIGQAYPGRTVIPIDCHDIILEGGALHCLSQQQPL